MAAEGEEIAVHRLNIHLEVRRTLSPIHHDGDIMGMRHLNHLLHRIHRSKHIAHMGYTDDFSPFRNQRFQLIETKLAIIRNGDMLHFNPPFHRLQLPADDVRVMLHLCDSPLIALLHLRFAERRSHEIDGLSGASRKHNLLNLPGIDKLTHLFACSLVQICGLLTQIVHPTMHIGIHIEILIAHRIQHTQRLLRRRSIVEIHQRFLINLPRQNGEILPYLIDIVHIHFLPFYFFTFLPFFMAYGHRFGPQWHH